MAAYLGSLSVLQQVEGWPARSALDLLVATDAQLHAKLQRNLMRVVVSRLRSLNAEVAELTR